MKSVTLYIRDDKPGEDQILMRKMILIQKQILLKMIEEKYIADIEYLGDTLNVKKCLNN